MQFKLKIHMYTLPTSSLRAHFTDVLKMIKVQFENSTRTVSIIVILSKLYFSIFIKEKKYSISYIDLTIQSFIFSMNK